MLKILQFLFPLFRKEGAGEIFSKMAKTKLFPIIFLFFGLLIGLISQWPDNNMHFIACNVGQGDAILLTSGQAQVLIDGGPNNQVEQCLSEHLPFWDRTIELVVATHPDKDHIAGLVKVIENYNVMSFVSINKANDTTYFNNLRSEIQKKGIKVHLAQKGDQIIVGKIKLNLLSPAKEDRSYLVWSASGADSASDPADKQILGSRASSSPPKADNSSNDDSVVMRASFGNFDALLTGDITSAKEKELESQHLSDIEVLKVSHHGSKYATSQEFLDKLRPKLAVIAVGKNQWGHPAAEVLERLRNLEIKILRTDTDGEIEVVSDGQGWQIKN
ncbi:hypothetical protein A2160_01720 [Candidatus Beckwithbacteria bacterium RBG_13_42_9]|uniref:Metallo-beta-lactamase domain-containing protein n=1 Tax=Candidatus Beckwithbacteria bacterium RBG_13_42_9 TaxID=1797457 RepID=A0A1F5E3P2_9BACT|nr:MAG: hypothetical protein A2160_01720 [Candidatus Beckwithbacteria bacterium RBG_13_42_9]